MIYALLKRILLARDLHLLNKLAQMKNEYVDKEEIQVQGNTIKNPEDWKTGSEPMTGAQNSYLHTLASEAHEEMENELTKAEASKKIEELQQKTGRGSSHNSSN
jgi:hypothetical protein